MVAKLVFKVHSRSYFGDARFRLKLAPQADELLSSWLIRIALEHRTMPSTFTNLYLPETINKLWATDLDLQADDKLISTLAVKSSLPLERLREMTLRSYEGFLFEEVYSKCGGTPFILPLAMRGRHSTLPGLRYCPLCLRDNPYFRKKWRLSFSLVCPQHRCFLRDRCANCESPIVPYKGAKGDSFPVCHRCGVDLARMEANPILAGTELLSVIIRLHAILDEGFVMLDGRPVYSHLFFRVLRQILKIMIGSRLGGKFLETVGIEQLTEKAGNKWNSFESLPMVWQAPLVVEAVRLLDDWPQRFVNICDQLRIRSSILLRDMRKPPFWYEKIVLEYFFRPDRILSDEEIFNAIRILNISNIYISECKLSTILGARQVFRKRKLKLLDYLPK